MKTAQHTPDAPEVPQPRLPFDPERLHRLELAADAAYAVTRQLSARRDELRVERSRWATSIHNAEYPPEQGVYLPGAAPQESYDRLAFVEDQIRAVEAEMEAHNAKAAPLRHLAQACIEWARRRSWRGNNAIGIPGPDSRETPAPVPLRIDGPMPVTHRGPPPGTLAAPSGSGFGSLMSKAATDLAARLTGGPRHGR